MNHYVQGNPAQFFSQFIVKVIFSDSFSGKYIMFRGIYWECGSVIFSSINFVVSHVDNHVSRSYMCKSDTYFFFHSRLCSS